MKKNFLDAYERELALLYERSQDFAADYPGIAERLGGLVQDNMDPAVAGLLEGTAFMAARVQLKMKQEFRTFTNELLEQLLPDMLAPTPAVMLVQAQPPYANQELLEGMSFPQGSYMDARYVDREKRISARFRLSAPLELWPLKITDAAYLDGPAPLQALGFDVAPGTAGGLKISFMRPSMEDPDKAEGPMSELEVDRLPIHLIGDMSETVALYEQLFCNVNRITLRYLDPNGDPAFIRLDPGVIEQIGFDDDEALFPEDIRVFRGYTTLREAFLFPQKFIGFRLAGINKALKRIQASEFDLIIELNTVKPSLPSRVGKQHFALFAVPAVNLFEENSSQVKVDPLRHEYIVTPDSSPSSNYEVHRITDVFAYYSGVQTKVPVHPLYGVPAEQINPREALYYTYSRKARRLTQNERRFGVQHNYKGTETFISIYEPEDLDDDQRVRRLQVKTLCSNRHLPEYLPLNQKGTDFNLNDDLTVDLSCIAGPTAPREAVADMESDAPHRTQSGDVYWRLVSHLSLNQFGLSDRGSRDHAAGLREMLSLFADLTNKVTEKQLQAIKGIETRPVVRSVKRDGGYHAARGIEVRVTFDERGYEGSGIMFLGTILDRFFADYSAINSFTQTVIVSQQRGDVKVWPPRSGSGPLL
jgi:type VI secretion system protein ImpG